MDPPIKQEPGEDAANAPRLMFAIDYGTSTLTATYRIDDPERPGDSHDVKEVKFANNTEPPPQLVAFDQTGQFHWGAGIAHALERDQISADDIIESLKLCLYKSHRSAPLVKRVRTKLHALGKTVEEVIALHLQHIFDFSIAFVKKRIETKSRYSLEEVDRMPIVAFVSVPQMWKAPANRLMSLAAKSTGAATVELVLEPRCAAAYYLQNVTAVSSESAYFSAGDAILVVDIGGGTCDIVCYALDDSIGAQGRLITIGEANGDLCGSEFVNQEMFEDLKRRAAEKHGTLESCLAELSMTESGFSYYANEAFTPKKKSFNQYSKKDIDLDIRGKKGAHFYTVLTSNDIRRYFQPVMDRIFACIDVHINRVPQIKDILVPGGFGNSEYLLHHLARKYPEKTIVEGDLSGIGSYHPVAKGALYRYSDVSISGKPPRDVFGISAAEKYDPKRHPDAELKKGQIDQDGRVVKRARLDKYVVQRDRNNKDYKTAYNRFQPLRSDTSPQLIEVWQQKFEPRDTHAQLELQIYWTDRDIAAGAPIFKKQQPHQADEFEDEDEDELADGIEEWGPSLKADRPDFKGLGFDLVSDDGRRKGYEFYWQVRLRLDNRANIKVYWRITQNPPWSHKKNGEPDFATPNPDGLGAVVDLLEENIVDESFKPWTRT
jgi:hypothetical protein